MSLLRNMRFSWDSLESGNLVAMSVLTGAGAGYLLWLGFNTLVYQSMGGHGCHVEDIDFCQKCHFLLVLVF